jgi:ribosome biogenesis GTPase
VLQAIEDGKLDNRRLANYKKLLRENALATRTLAEKHAYERHFGRVVKEAISMKRSKGET